MTGQVGDPSDAEGKGGRNVKDEERIAVWIWVKDGKTECVCPRWRKHCGRHCQKDYVTRDFYDGLDRIWQRDRYGR